MMDFCSSVLEAKLGVVAGQQSDGFEPPSYYHMDSPYGHDLGLLDEPHSYLSHAFEETAGCDETGDPICDEGTARSMLSREINQTITPHLYQHSDPQSSDKASSPSDVMSPSPTSCPTATPPITMTAPERVPFSSFWAGGIEDYHGISVLWAIVLVVISTVAVLYQIIWLHNSELLPRKSQARVINA